MKEKYEELKKQLIEVNNNTKKCNHEWSEPVYDPDLFDGIDRWYTVCKLCGEKVMSFNESDIKMLTMKKNN